ncbi:DegT/DnrJ/EryC1/StrS aminotransferase family protein [Treponema parvum]|uniref:DegT/DnrJ/EryC1/StrS aminotransferase family protein n=1 Tax=Treponema parvum TaxID=138851 RepID=A0A975IED9_9SPIR|nr:DegT/DnrJ/EryC1/StrS family aminotransferase [Treponema parvum]QTQ13707.1 DegT/DnrJ/EryC1/StrS aminotransferase family protein [Treponema parvum]
MIQTFSSTIRRREMDAVLTCMVDEKIGPGELNARLIQSVKDNFSCAGAVALRSPSIALYYALKAMELASDSVVMISALAPSWQLLCLENFGYKLLVLDVDEKTGLVTPDIVFEGIKKGGRVLLLHETMGIMPDMQGIMDLGIPVIEDISQSAGAVYKPDAPPEESAQEFGGENKIGSEPAAPKAGSFGLFTIMGLEEHDIITAGGGAVLMASNRRDWTVLKKYTDNLPQTDLLPDINSALGWVQLKEYRRNEEIRKEIFSAYYRSLLSGKNKTFLRAADEGSAAWGFPVILSGSYKDVKQYASKKDIEIRSAYEQSVIALRPDEIGASCRTAKSLLLRCALFPMYPRLGKNQVIKVSRVLGTLP